MSSRRYQEEFEAMKPHLREALRVAGVYALFGILWIFLSDRFLISLAPDIDTLTILQTWKGWGFILFTATLIFFLTKRALLEHTGLIRQVEQSRSDYRALFEQSPTGLALCRMDGTLVDVNPAFAGIIGRSVDKTLGLTYWQITPDSYAEEEARQLESLEHTGRYGPYEKEYLHTDGHRVPVRLTGLIVERSGERMIWSSVEDITERKSAEAKIQRLTQLYATLSQCNQAIVRCTSEDELFSQICRDAVQFGGMKMAWIGLVDEASRRVRPVAAYGDGTEYLEGIRISVDADDPFGRGPTGISIRDNQPFWCQDFQQDPTTAPWHERGNNVGWHASASLPLLRNGIPIGSLTLYADTVNAFDDDARKLLIEMATDINFALDNFAREAEHKRATEALRESEAQFRGLVENSLVGVYLIQDGRFVYANPKMAELFGCDPAAIVGLQVADLVHPDDVPLVREKLHQREVGKVLQSHYEFRARRRGGTTFPVEVYGTRVEYQGGPAIIGSLLDITEHKLIQQIQQVRNEVLDQIIANRPLPDILESIAHRLEAIHPETRVSILLMDRQTGRLSVGAAPSLPDFYNAAVEGLEPGPGMGSCGMAAHMGEPMIVEDIATHPDWAPYREITARAGISACWSVPFKDDAGQVLGTFGIYYETPRSPTPADLELIAEFARITGLAVQKALVEAERLQSEQRFRATFEQSTLLKGIVAQDGTLLTANQAALDVIGAQASDVIGQPFWHTSWWRDDPAQQERLKQAIIRATGGQTDHFETTHPKPDGSMMVVEFRTSPIQIGNNIQVLVAGIDITERKLTEETLRQSATVFASSHDGVMITDLDARILGVNPAFTEITGYTEAEVLGQNPRLLQSGRQDRSFYQALWASLIEAGHWQGEVWNRRKNGEIYPEWLTISTVRDEQGEPSRYAAVFSDISQIKQSEAKLEHLAHYDALTQLPNRLLLFSRLEHSIEVAQRDGRLLALLMLDLDRFKNVNDSFGHLAGDELLQQVAERLTSCLRGIDTVCRLGGDEFTVLLEEIAQPEDAARVANDIIAALSEPWHLSNGAEVRIGASVGISLFPDHGKTAAELLQQADTSLYQAKTEGRGRFKYFSEELTHAVRARIELEARLRRAIEQNELRVFYQPQVDIASGRIVGAEALVRWQHPTDGLIPPAHFIPVAEETGLITPIGNWVLEETCRQGQRWIEAGLPPLTLAVNLSPHQFLHSNIEQVVALAIAETGFPAERLELELTESALMEREAEAIQILNHLRMLGVRLAIDDFGTGYSSLAYLKRFPLDVLKVDKSFVDDIPHGLDDMAITATIIAMAHTLRLKVLAEGVETKEQLDFLQAQGCDMYQGYLTSPPVPAEKFEKLLAAQPHGKR